MELSAKERIVLGFVQSFLGESGYPPTVRDIVSGCELSSTSVAAYYLNKLEAAGYLRRHADISRGIELLVDRKERRLVSIPVIGEIAAGQPIPVPDNDTWSTSPQATIEVSPDLVRGRQGIYGLRVRGNSLIDALINDGDIALVEYTTIVGSGDLAAIWLKKEKEATLKKFYPEGDRVRLQPANSQMSPMYTTPDNVAVQGKVIAVVRQLSQHDGQYSR
ncbi:MAG: transcriptional repressor LexA [Chloroflexota bacterium]